MVRNTKLVLVNTLSSRDHGIFGGGLTAGRLFEGRDHISSIGLPRADAVKLDVWLGILDP